MKRELLLVLIVTYNRLSDLKICVETVRKQTYKYFNILGCKIITTPTYKFF